MVLPVKLLFFQFIDLSKEKVEIITPIITVSTVKSTKKSTKKKITTVASTTIESIKNWIYFTS